LAVPVPEAVKKSELTLESLRAASQDGVVGLSEEGRNNLSPRTRAHKHTTVVDKKATNRTDELTPVQEKAARLFAAGKTIPQIAKLLGDTIHPHVANRPYQLKKSRTTLRRWFLTNKMRDAVYEHGRILLDLESTAIMRGISRKAREGRVDAARLALELNGRHAPNTEEKPAQIVLAFGNVPRPEPRQLEDAEVVDVDPD